MSRFDWQQRCGGIAFLVALNGGLGAWFTAHPSALTATLFFVDTALTLIGFATGFARREG